MMIVAASGAKRYSCFTNSRPPSFLPFPWLRRLANGGRLPPHSPKHRAAELINVTGFTTSIHATIKLTLMGQRPREQEHRPQKP